VITSKRRSASAYFGSDQHHTQGIALTSQATATVEKSSTDSTDPLIARFLDAVWMERGLSSNTLAAYRADL
jgi:hypothetical protein